ncbi:hypothetical protein, partial [Roseibium polysiphoniae]|uniref:hypothetical protein n=1 Tax=Roseibium polysiphoniae TaxID=2571221 RepID=UPI0032993B69
EGAADQSSFENIFHSNYPQSYVRKSYAVLRHSRGNFKCLARCLAFGEPLRDEYGKRVTDMQRPAKSRETGISGAI